VRSSPGCAAPSPEHCNAAETDCNTEVGVLGELGELRVLGPLGLLRELRELRELRVLGRLGVLGPLGKLGELGILGILGELNHAIGLTPFALTSSSFVSATSCATTS